MDHPDKGASRSYAGKGDVQNPEDVVSVVVSGENDEVDGILEKWSGDSWIYCPADDLEPLN